MAIINICWAPAQPEHDPTRMGESLPKPEFMLFVLVVDNNNRSIVIKGSPYDDYLRVWNSI